jgi:hypothetical protein
MNIATAQSNTPIFFKDNIPKKNVVGIGFAYENTLYAGLSYDRVVKIHNKHLSLGLAFESPLLLLAEKNKRIALNGSVYLLHTNFNIRTQATLSTNFYEDVLSKGQFMDASIGLFPGYYKAKYFVSAEISYKNNIFTTFHFTENSSVKGGNLIVYNTMGNGNLGLNAGVLVKNRLEIKARLCYNMPRNFKNYAPYTQNIAVNLGLSYWL